MMSLSGRPSSSLSLPLKYWSYCNIFCYYVAQKFPIQIVHRMIVGRGRRADVPDSPLPFLQEVFQNHSFISAGAKSAGCSLLLLLLHPLRYPPI